MKPNGDLQSKIKKDTNKLISVEYVTVRQSISLLLLKLIVLELIFATVISGVYYFISNTPISGSIGLNMPLINIPLFIFFVLLKILIMIYIVVLWVNDYYKISSLELIHKRGFIFKKEEKDLLEHLGALKLDQGLLGRIFNFGTLTLYNWALEQNVVMYNIHNPVRYRDILRILLPNIDEGKSVFREHLLDEDLL